MSSVPTGGAAAAAGGAAAATSDAPAAEEAAEEKEESDDVSLTFEYTFCTILLILFFYKLNRIWVSVFSIKQLIYSSINRTSFTNKSSVLYVLVPENEITNK
jgi:hypothetical protein